MSRRSTRFSFRLRAAAALVACALPAAGCASFGRETCNSTQLTLGESPAHEDTKVIQRLMIALSTRDFESFTAMQPSQSQYVAVAWRHGGERADAMASVLQHPGQARREFMALVERFDHAGLEPRRAERCTRRMTVNGEAAHPLYALTVDVGPFALAVPVYRSTDRTSLAGQPVVEDPVMVDTMARAVMLQVGLLKQFEKARVDTEALVLMNDFLEDNERELAVLRERVGSTSWQAVEGTTLSKYLTPFHADFGHRWQALQRQFPTVFESEAFREFAATFYPEADPNPQPKPEMPRPPSDPDNVMP
jgi:hypothetical protein